MLQRLFAVTLVAAAIASAETPLAFEVASIKPGDPDKRGMQIQNTPGGRFNAKNVSVKLLIQHAYDVKEFQISGGPAWINSPWDITAKADGTATPAQIKQMIQTLLADRFKLTIRRETKELPSYALVVGKNGPKLKESENAGREANGAGRKAMFMMGRGRLDAQGIHMGAFVNQLARQVNRPVIDKTGLTGTYDIKLEWTPDDNQMARLKAEAEGAPAIDPNGPSIFTAVQEQLGLKLEAQKGEVETLFIERLEKPTEN
jgi:uncharacterized protein (TIGR03435 family)